MSTQIDCNSHMVVCLVCLSIHMKNDYAVLNRNSDAPRNMNEMWARFCVDNNRIPT